MGVVAIFQLNSRGNHGALCPTCISTTAAGKIKACRQGFPGTSCWLPALLLWDLGLVEAGITAVWSSAAPLDGEMAIRYEECCQSIICLTPEKEIFLLWTWSLTGFSEIIAICDGLKSFGSCPGGSLDRMAVPWQGEDLHDLIGILHLQYLYFHDYW